MRGLQPVGLDTLQEYNVNVEGVPDVIWQPIWDYQTYPLAGFTGETLFFQVPKGQAGKTLEDTNMGSQGRMPSPVNMLVTGVEVFFRSGRLPYFVAAAVPAATDSQINDIEALAHARMSLTLKIGDQVWLEEAPLGVFPQQFYLDGFAAAQSKQAVAADANQIADYVAHRGPMYQVMPYRLISNQEFVVTIRSPVAVPLPSGVDGRWGVRLHGYRFRLAT